ncbi:MAG: hypothetical protein WC679_02300 [Bacteroidales bacterium]
MQSYKDYIEEGTNTKKMMTIAWHQDELKKLFSNINDEIDEAQKKLDMLIKKKELLNNKASIVAKAKSAGKTELPVFKD